MAKRPKRPKTAKQGGEPRPHPEEPPMPGKVGNNGELMEQPTSDSPGQPPSAPPCRIIVIGGSAGGVEALMKIARALAPSLPAAVFAVLHISPDGPSLLPEILNRSRGLRAVHPSDQVPIVAGHIYVAPPDHHLLVRRGCLRVTRGPRENNARPAVDPLFRTAANSYGPWVIGVVLTGGMDDGTLGLMEIKRHGGIAVVQDPDDAMFPGMPSSAVENVNCDYVLPLSEIPSLLTRLARSPVPADLGAEFMARHRKPEPDIAEVGTDALKSHSMNGPPSKFTCPECGGALWEFLDGKLVRYRCHVGHGFTADTLVAAQNAKLEDALWNALRALEESAAMNRRMADRARKGRFESLAIRYDENAELAEERASVVRSVLTSENATATPQERRSEQEAIAARDQTLDHSTLNPGGAAARAPRKQDAPGRRARKGRTE